MSRYPSVRYPRLRSPSLIELLVVIGILGILACVVVFAVGHGTTSDREQCFADGGSSYSERTGCVWTPHG